MPGRPGELVFPRSSKNPRDPSRKSYGAGHSTVYTAGGGTTVVTYELDNNRRGNAVDTAFIDSARPLAQAIKPIQESKNSIIAKLEGKDFSNPQAGDYTTPADIDTAPEWPQSGG